MINGSTSAYNPSKYRLLHKVGSVMKYITAESKINLQPSLRQIPYTLYIHNLINTDRHKHWEIGLFCHLFWTKLVEIIVFVHDPQWPDTICPVSLQSAGQSTHGDTPEDDIQFADPLEKPLNVDILRFLQICLRQLVQSPQHFCDCGKTVLKINGFINGCWVFVTYKINSQENRHVPVADFCLQMQGSVLHWVGCQPPEMYFLGQFNIYIVLITRWTTVHQIPGFKYYF